MKNILNIKGLTIEGFNDNQWSTIVDGVDLTLARGEVLGLIGESGAGKSTIGLASMGYSRRGCRISSGSILFDGTELCQASDRVKQKIRGTRIAYVAQSAAASFNPAHRLIRQCTETRVRHGQLTAAQAEKEAIENYRRLLLPDPEGIGFRYPHQVSGGQLQRAMVAMAMACKPDIIVFDEPTTALDVTTQIEVLNAIKQITRHLGTAALYITHDLAVVSQLADRIMVLKNGRKVEENQTRKLLDTPGKSYTQKLLSVRSQRPIKKPVQLKQNVILEVNQVSAAYKKKELVLDTIDLTIRRGQTVALVGESGSGKSTLARAITGLLPPLSGEVIFQGNPLGASYRSRDRESLRKMQMIYQMPETALNPKQTIETAIGRPLSFYFGISGREKRKQVLEFLDRIELPASYINRYPGELSGGEKQRVCVARALAAKPELVICDEVTSALDNLVGEEILKLLQNLQNDLGVSYLFITHDLATVRAIADEVVVMLKGKIVEKGPRNKILNSPGHDYTKRLLNSVPKMNPDWLDDLLEKRKNTRSKKAA
ncbi:MAG: ABC transporter ATP-binding protein [Desulfobacterium sp.]|nr:ABC transporter ATP-binding protein [Desulfobacterium sp.]